MSKKPEGLTDHQKELFDAIESELRREAALAYISNGYSNKVQAYRDACSKLGKSVSKNPTTSAAEILNYPSVSEFIASVRHKAAENAQIDAQFILDAAKDIYDRCTQKVAPALTRGGEKIFDEDGNPIYAFDAKNALSALKLMGDHVEVQAFKKIVESRVVIQDMSDDELNRELAALTARSED